MIVFTITILLLGVAPGIARAAETATTDSYQSSVLSDKPVAYWPFTGKNRGDIENAADDTINGQAVGPTALGREGARPPRYLTADKDNTAIAIPGRGYMKVKDPGENSPLDFDIGDTITLEAWVDLHALGNDQNIYVFGKGRTNNSGFARENQNYALRLRGVDGTACLSFLFRSHTGGKGGGADYHRWNSDVGFPAGSGWHHLAVSYTFGQADSLQGYIDGKRVPGTWDMAGKTKAAPVVDNDELWIGSALGGSAGNTFTGRIDEVAIYRHGLSADRIDDRYRIDGSKPIAPAAELPNAPEDEVLIQIFEGVPDGVFNPTGEPTIEFTTTSLALVDLPKKYNEKGLITDWKQPLLVRAITKISPVAGQYQWLLRAKDTARLQVNGRVLAQTPRMNYNGSGHNHVPDLEESADPLMRPLSPGIQQKMATLALAGKPATVVLETFVGSKNMRPEVSEMTVALAREDASFQIVSPVADLPLTDDAWNSIAAEQLAMLAQFNRTNRRAASQSETEFWNHRHEIARRHIAKQEPIKIPAGDFPNPIDRFIAAQLIEEKLTATETIDDQTFLRRATLDIVGVIPTPQEIVQFQADTNDGRRERVTDRLLADPRWADHWVSYWQDVLAENPNVLKGKLNNTGPFRWWIYEALEDNRPIDRFATELIMMEGSKWYGGPAGFALATENDAPMAAKAHVIGKAFMAVEMKCARCHDAPFHDVTQEDTFNIAAMLGRGGQKIPKTSVVPLAPGARRPELTMSLKPGDVVKPKWPFEDYASGDVAEELLRNADDERARLAAIITSPDNERFAKVIVNRIWANLMGRGIVEPVDDWEDARPSHPELLKWLARELVANDYDAKHIARLILTSQSYQRQVDGDATREARKYFATPTRRRMTAEQLVDSVFLAAGKSFGAEVLSLDPEGRRPVESFLNLGVPTRAWQFSSLSNERDRPALAMPVTQSVVDVLVTFGWREARQDPISDRDHTPTLLQPAVLANGLVGRRITTLSDDSELTALALKEQSPQALVDSIFARLLSRQPTTDESQLFVELLSDGYENRINHDAVAVTSQLTKRNAVSWSNHLSAEATNIKLELERLARAGDPPTKRLDADWRERMEDMVWAVLNSPEFVFVP